MAQDTSRQSLALIVSNLRAAELLLLQASRATAEPATLMKINTEFQAIDSYLSQVISAQVTQDDRLFDSATNALKQQASSLQQEEVHIKTIIADVGIAAQIIGFIAQAAAIAVTL